MMSEKRFYVKKVTRDERPKLFSSVGADYKYFIVERVKRSWGEYGGNFLFNFDVDYAFAEKVCNLLNEQQATIIKLQDRLFAKEKTIDRLENTIAHLNQSDNSLKKNKKITELANIIYNMKMVLSNDEKQITKIIEAYQDEIDKWKGRTAILLKERWNIE